MPIYALVMLINVLVMPLENPKMKRIPTKSPELAILQHIDISYIYCHINISRKL